MAAEHATPEMMAFFVRHTSGLICAPITNERADELDLPLMVARNTESQRTAFTVTVDYRHGTTTGISAARPVGRPSGRWSIPTTRPERPRPARPPPRAAGPGGRRAQAGRPHRGGGRPGPPGRAVPRPGCSARWSPRTASGWPGSPSSRRFAARHDLLLITIADLIRYRRQTRAAGAPDRPRPACRPSAASSAASPTRASSTTRPTWPSSWASRPGEENVLVRVHSECLTGDVFGSRRCDCGAQLQAAMRHDRRGRPRGGRLPAGPRGPGHRHHPQAAGLRAAGRRPATPWTPTWSWACRSTAGSTASAPRSSSTSGSPPCGCMTNNPAKRGGLEGFGLRDRRAGARSTPCPTRRTSATCAPSGTGWATCSTRAACR